MSGVWVFNNGVVRLVENPGDCQGRKMLIHLPTNEVITSYAVLERKLFALGVGTLLRRPRTPPVPQAKTPVASNQNSNSGAANGWCEPNSALELRRSPSPAPAGNFDVSDEAGCGEM
nr:flowering-promoting factor 1-like protein 3 [Ipomoea trifida]